MGRVAVVGANALLLLAAVGACAPAPSPALAAPADDRPVVLTTFTVLADLAANVAGEHARVESLTRPGVEIHGYEPTPGDVARAAGADLVLDNGLGLETWFERFVAEADAPHVVVSTGIDPIEIDGEVGRVDPHAWMSPANAQEYVAAIAGALAALDPEPAAAYAANAAAFAAEIAAVHEEALAARADVPESRRVLVTCEGAFGYLARDLGLEDHSLWPLNGEAQVTPRRLAAVIDVVRSQGVPAVFCESTVSHATMRQVAAETGAVLAGTLHVDSLSGPDGPVPTYLDLLRHDVDTIVAGLT